MTTLPFDSEERKLIPLHRGVFRYFPAALAGVARISYQGNARHNGTDELHHARGKSADHADCILRHLMDLEDHMARALREDPCGGRAGDILAEASCLAWRALALSQTVHEKFGGAPLAPGAKHEADPSTDWFWPYGACRWCDEPREAGHARDCYTVTSRSEPSL